MAGPLSWADYGMGPKLGGTKYGTPAANHSFNFQVLIGHRIQYI